MRIFVASDVLAQVGADAREVRNRSLVADRYVWFTDNLSDKKDHAAAKQKSVQRICAATEFDDGPAWNARRDALAAFPGALVIRAKLGARLIINQAGGVVENAGISLDRNSGVPVIPGSAVKGIARAGAALAGATPTEIALVFGWTSGRKQEPDLPERLPVNNFAGSVTFLPAFPTGSVRIETDIVNSHHPDYYSRKKDLEGRLLRATASDDENPNPNLFPTIARGSEFQFVLAPTAARRAAAMQEGLRVGASADVLTLARAWLLAGLTEHGLGAKTAAGYGWFAYDGAAERARAAEAAQQLALKQFQERRAKLTDEERYAEDLPKLDLLTEFANVDKMSEARRRLLVQAIRARGPEATLNKQKNEKGQKRVARFLELCRQLGSAP